MMRARAAADSCRLSRLALALRRSRGPISCRGGAVK